MIYDKYIGIPFVDGGRDEDGVDCWGLMKLIMKNESGIELPEYDISAFEFEEVSEKMEEDIWMWEEVKGARAGRFVAIALHPKHPTIVNHVGLCINNTHFIHTREKTGCLIEPINSPVWKSRIIGVYEWAG